MNWAEVTAIFGGTFDPPHIGHREAVLGLFKNPGVKHVLIVPSATPPLKTAHATAEQRAEMARLCFEGIPDTSLDLRELKRQGPSYTYDTLMELRRKGRDPMAIVIGMDQLVHLQKWHRYPEILVLVHWIVLERKGALDGFPLFQGAKVVETAAPRISSTRIRETIALTGEAPKDSLLPSVEAYLKKNHLYGT